MSEVAPPLTKKPVGGVVIAALWVGLAVGLVEGVGWMIVQRFGRLTNLWTQVLWIAPVLDGLLFLALGLFLAAISRLLPRKVWLPFSGFAIGLAAAANFVALVFQSYMHPLALLVLALGLAAALNRWFQRREEAALRFFRRSLPAVVGLVLLALIGVQGFYAVTERFAVAALPDGDDPGPNVVVVVIDALRSDRVSAYGNPRRTTPFIDELARGGVRFETAMAASPYTLPSHASLLSGLFSNAHGVEWLEFYAFRDAEYPSIAESLGALGYRTGAFSANPFWFTREQGYGRGFDHFEDFYHNAADMGYRTVFGKIFEKVIMPRIGMENVPARKEATESTERALDWIGRDDDHPFFAFINYFDVHDPYLPPQPYRGRFSDEEAPGGILNWRLGRGESDLTPEQRESELEAYDGALAYVDDEIRRLVEGVRALRPGEDLIVIVTSDHGEAFGEHGTFLHGKSLYREEIQIPLVVWGPGRVPTGLSVARPVTHASIPATILDLVSGGEATTYGAPSLVSLWTDPDVASTWPLPRADMKQRDWVDPAFKVAHGDITSVTSPDWYYIAYDTLPEELFEWADVRQATDRSRDPELQGVLESFRTLLPGGGR